MTTDHDTIERLRAAMAGETRDHHLDPGAARAALDDASRRRVPLLAVAACLLGVLALAGGVLFFRPAGSTPNAGSGPSCVLDSRPLPDWAQAGFSTQGVHTPHVVGDGESIVAIPFVTLRVHQPKDTFNKVLWVSRDQVAAQLTIRATLGDQTETRTVDLGPSYLDLPSAGCWSLELSWPGHHDRLNLAVAP